LTTKYQELEQKFAKLQASIIHQAKNHTGISRTTCAANPNLCRMVQYTRNYTGGIRNRVSK
jgi:hypothetical protein